MKESYLEVTYRHGRPVAAYLYLPRASRDRSHRTSKAGEGLLVDYTRGGKPIGIEFTSPTRVKSTAVNRVLKDLGFAPMKEADLAPIRAA